MDGDGWQISEVMALLGMGRRAIQRSCGQNPASGDLGIVRVDGGKPGRRSYGADELAQLHLVNAMNQDGMDLASVRDAFERARSSDGVECLAERRCELDVERAEAAEARLRRDRALASRGDARRLGELIEREVAAALARAGHAGPFPAGWLLPRLRRAVACGTWEGEVPDGLLAALEAPGLELLELMVLLLVAGAILGLVVATVVVTRFFLPAKEVVHEVETLSPSVVFERVVAQNELVCASQNYAIVDKATDTARLFDLIDLPWTTNSFWYRYCGTIKAGVNLQTAEFSQDEGDANKLTVTLDQPYVISNTPDMSKSGVLEERNNIFNNIDVSDVDAFQRQCVERSEQEVVDGGLYNEARANAEANLKAMFAAALGNQAELTVVFREA